MTNNGDQPVGTRWLEGRAYLAQKCYLGLKCVDVKDQMTLKCTRNEFRGHNKSKTLLLKCREKRNKEKQLELITLYDKILKL